MDTAMSNVVSLLTKSSTSPQESSAEALPAPMPVHWVERLFERLAAILGSKMADIVAGSSPEAVKREWSEALAGFGDDELRRGIAATRTRRFPPNLPEFLHLCRPALDPETAWLEAAKGLKARADGTAFAWSHPAVYWAARMVESELRSSTYAAQRKRWDWLLAEQWAKGVWANPPNPAQPALAYQPSLPTVTTASDAIREKLRRDAEELRARATMQDLGS
jgi:hypothetical protein